ncbi:F-box domain-containing protein [Artemisia annua]|uniref:F-box domain-containing protein n=1 Tax=Artemisia annua TaxID=35608 RepID=A0A2U1NQ02_ARTAN|nr:F-box domain-containing protein [Artemisia annua]
MVDVLIPDCILHDILARLPTKSLLRFKCVSKHCNRLILDPYFIKLRARRMILLPVSPFHVLDDGNFPLDYESKLMFKLLFPFGNPKDKDIKCLGTVNRIVILVVKA